MPAFLHASGSDSDDTFEGEDDECNDDYIQNESVNHASLGGIFK